MSQKVIEAFLPVMALAWVEDDLLHERMMMAPF
jgi:hypothetical protein